MFGDFGRDLRRHTLVPGMNCTDRLDQLLSQETFQEVSPCAGFESAHNLDIASISGQHDDSCVRELAANCPHCIEAVQLRHLQVHERDVGNVFSELFDRLTPVGGFRDQLHIRLTGDECGNALAEEGVVVYGKYSNQARIIAHESSLPSQTETCITNLCDREMSRMQSSREYSSLSPCQLQSHSRR